jgi:hypothetical protein
LRRSDQVDFRPECHPACVTAGIGPRREVADWRPIAGTPPLVIACYLSAHSLAGSRGAPEGDTTFAWLPALVIVPVLVAAPLTLALLLARKRKTLGAPVASTALAIALAIWIVAAPLSTIAATDGYPSDAIAIVALIVAAILSLSPTAWMWHDLQRRRTSDFVS